MFVKMSLGLQPAVFSMLKVFLPRKSAFDEEDCALSAVLSMLRGAASIDNEVVSEIIAIIDFCLIADGLQISATDEDLRRILEGLRASISSLPVVFTSILRLVELYTSTDEATMQKLDGSSGFLFGKLTEFSIQKDIIFSLLVPFLEQ